MPNSVNDIVVSNRQSALDLVRNWLADRPKDDPRPRQSRKYLALQMVKYSLSTADLNTLCDALLYGAGFPHALKYIGKGFTPDEVVALYQIRHFLSQYVEETVSIKSIIRYVRTFASSGFGEEESLSGDEVATEIAEALFTIRGFAPWLHYPDHAIANLCDAAEYFQLSDVWTAVRTIEGGARRERGPND